jgi:hypothetical protein
MQFSQIALFIQKVCQTAYFSSIIIIIIIITVWISDNRLTVSCTLISGNVVISADESLLIQNVKLVTGVQQPLTDDTGKTLDVVHGTARPPHQVIGRDALAASSTLGAKPSVKSVENNV